MAFGDALGKTDGATVRLSADTQSFNADVSKAEATWRESVAGMSREALRLDLAQDRLKKSLDKYGASAAQTKRATIQLKDAEEQAARAADRQTKELGELNRVTRSTSAGLASMRGRVVGLAASFVGVYGLVGAIRSSIEAAKEQQVVMGQTRVALESIGITWDQVAARINRGAEALATVSGFDDEDILRSFQVFARRTKDVELALRLTAVAADVARGRYVELEAGQNLVLKASLGQAGALRRVGIETEKGAKASDLLNQLQRSYAGAAEEYGRSAAGASDKFNKALEDTKEIIGEGVLPAITDLLGQGTKWLNQANRSGELQARLNQTLATGEQVVRGFGGALGITRAVLGPLVDDLGGVSRAVEILLIGGFVAKGAKAAKSLGLLRAALWVLGPTATKSAVQVVAAEQAMGAGALTAATRVNVLLRSLTRILVAYYAVQAAVDALTPGKQGLDLSTATGAAGTPVFRRGIGWVNPGNDQRVPDQRYWDRLTARGFYDPSSGKREKPSEREQREARQRLRGEQPTSRGLGVPPKMPDYTQLNAPTTATDIAGAVERGAERGTERGVLRATGQQGRVGRVGIGAGGGLGRVQAARARPAAGPGLTEADIRRIHVDFLNTWQGAKEQYGSNYTADGAQVATNTWTTSRLLYEQNRLLEGLTRSVAHPGARYARTELSASYGGVGGI